MDSSKNNSQTNVPIVGIDVSKDKLDVAVCKDTKGNVVSLPTVNNSPKGWKQLISLLKQKGIVPSYVCMEPTAHYHLGLANYLILQGFKVCVLHSKAVKDYSSSLHNRNKTDKIDASVIATFGAHQAQIGRLREYEPNTRAEQALKDQVNLLISIKRDVRAAHNRLASIIDKKARRRQQKVIRFLEKQQEAIERDIERICEEEKELSELFELLKSIPGAGLTAAILLSEGIHNAKDIRSLVAMHALCPSHRQSGSSLNTSRLSPRGRRLLRTALYFPALVAIQHNPLVKVFHKRLASRGMRGKSLVCACIHKDVIPVHEQGS